MANLNVYTPQGVQLLKEVNIEFLPQHNYLLKGHSGIGKSTLIKIISDIWFYATGKVSMPAQKNMMYLSQRPYMPLGTLAETLAFPHPMSNFSEVMLADTLRSCHLNHFVPRLNEAASWGEYLSPGEQQRIAFARVLLQKPDWVFMDESTSMLDINSETALYTVLKNKLPQVTIVSIGHRPSLDAFHDVVIDLGQFAVQRQ